MVMDRAKAQDTTLSRVRRRPCWNAAAKTRSFENEVDKLCALSGYQTVTTAMVAEMGTVSLEADVFEMIRMITAKNATGACKSCKRFSACSRSPSPSRRP